jgi:hypothetical protein
MDFQVDIDVSEEHTASIFRAALPPEDQRRPVQRLENLKSHQYNVWLIICLYRKPSVTERHVCLQKILFILRIGLLIVIFILNWSHPGRALPSGKGPRYPLDKRWGGPQSRSGCRG